MNLLLYMAPIASLALIPATLLLEPDSLATARELAVRHPCTPLYPVIPKMCMTSSPIPSCWSRLPCYCQDFSGPPPMCALNPGTLVLCTTKALGLENCLNGTHALRTKSLYPDTPYAPETRINNIVI